MKSPLPFGVQSVPGLNRHDPLGVIDATNTGCVLLNTAFRTLSAAAKVNGDVAEQFKSAGVGMLKQAAREFDLAAQRLERTLLQSSREASHKAPIQCPDPGADS